MVNAGARVWCPSLQSACVLRTASAVAVTKTTRNLGATRPLRPSLAVPVDHALGRRDGLGVDPSIKSTFRVP